MAQRKFAYTFLWIFQFQQKDLHAIYVALGAKLNSQCLNTASTKAYKNTLYEIFCSKHNYVFSSNQNDFKDITLLDVLNKHGILDPPQILIFLRYLCVYEVKNIQIITFFMLLLFKYLLPNYIHAFGSNSYSF